MHPEYFGDSYDLVKRNLLEILKPLGVWSVHGMFSSAVSPEFVAAFERLLGARVVSAESVPRFAKRRETHLGLANAFQHVLFDPDTGLRAKGSRRHLALAELAKLARARPDSLSAVYDQSLGFGKRESELRGKLSSLGELGLDSFAYHSHACFVFTSPSGSILGAAREALLSAGLPANRLWAAT